MKMRAKIPLFTIHLRRVRYNRKLCFGGRSSSNQQSVITTLLHKGPAILPGNLEFRTSEGAVCMTLHIANDQ